jgi:hypothetical protein
VGSTAGDYEQGKHQARQVQEIGQKAEQHTAKAHEESHK